MSLLILIRSFRNVQALAAVATIVEHGEYVGEGSQRFFQRLPASQVLNNFKESVAKINLGCFCH